MVDIPGHYAWLRREKKSEELPIWWSEYFFMRKKSIPERTRCFLTSHLLGKDLSVASSSFKQNKCCRLTDLRWYCFFWASWLESDQTWMWSCLRCCHIYIYFKTMMRWLYGNRTFNVASVSWVLHWKYWLVYIFHCISSTIVYYCRSWLYVDKSHNARYNVSNLEKRQSIPTLN